MNTLKLLDCTLRDGGYYNNWQFNINDANKYLKQAYASKIDYVEIGFHFLKDNKNYGQFAFIDKTLIGKLKKSNSTKLAVMFNGADFISNKKTFRKKIKKIFSKKNSNLNAVRIAVHLRDLNKIKKNLIFFKKLNLKVFLNLMQINTVSLKKLAACLRTLNKWGCIDVFYFADSFGNMDPKKIKNLCNLIKKNWDKEFGIHSHDNCGLALKNSIQAFKSGATWIDGTVQGMGRGAGNVKTESLLKYFAKYKYQVKSINKISKNYFLNLKKKYKWGSSKYYKSAAKYDIHPSYIQELNKDDRYSKKDIDKLVKHLSTINAKSYDPRLLENLKVDINRIKGSWDANKWCSGRNILVVGQGPSLKNEKNKKLIKEYILDVKPLVLAININSNIPEKFIDFYATCNETRMLVDHKNYSKLGKPIILPFKKLKTLTGVKQKFKFLDYGATIQNSEFKCQKNYAVIPHNQSFGYSIAIALIGSAKNITLAGFDGYSKGHKNQIEMENTIKIIKSKYPKIGFSSLTKNKYGIINKKIL